MLLPQVPGCWTPVLFPGDTAHPLRQHPRLSTQAAAFLPELRGDHAQRGRGHQNQHPGVPTPVPWPPLELHHYQQQPGHLWPRAGQRYTWYPSWLTGQRWQPRDVDAAGLNPASPLSGSGHKPVRFFSASVSHLCSSIGMALAVRGPCSLL